MTFQTLVGKIFAVAVLFFAVFQLSAIEERRLTVEAGARGFRISNALVDVSLFSKMYACEPPWRDSRFYTLIDPISTEVTPEGAVIRQEAKKDIFALNDYSVALDGDSGVVTLDMELLQDLPTFMEYTVFCPPPELLAGTRYTAKLASGEVVTGDIPKAKATNAELIHLVENVVAFEAIGYLGTFSFKVEEGAPFTVADRRNRPFENMSCFWIGHAADMPYGERTRSVVSFSYKLNPDLEIAEPGKHVAGKNFDESQKSPGGESILYPVPRELQILEGSAVLGYNDTVIEFEKRIAPSDIARIQGYFKNKCVFGGTLRFTDDVDVPHPEGYILEVKDGRISITTPSARGAFYAIQAFTHLYPYVDSLSGKILNLRIRDWPDMDVRGIHIAHLDKYSLEHYRNIIENVMVPLKMNHILLECEYVGWDATEGLHNPAWGNADGVTNRNDVMTKAQLRELLQVARNNFIEVTPLVQTLSHSPWLFTADKNLDMAEDPDHPYTYMGATHYGAYAMNTSHPDLYPLLTKLFDEVRETFGNPQMFHIGMDELYLFGRFPHREESKRKGTNQIVLDHVMWAYDYCKKHDMQLAMWQDIFVTPEESPENGSGGAPHFTHKLREKLPKDILFTVWRYSGDYTEFKDLGALSAEGFPVIGASWYQPNNVENFTEYAKAHGARGMLSTTWIYTPNDESIYDYWDHQLMAYVRSGYWSWNASRSANENLDGNKVYTILDPWVRKNGSRDHLCDTVDISKAYNLSLSNNPFLYGDTYGISFNGREINNLYMGIFEVAGNDAPLHMVAVRSRVNPRFPEESPEIVLNAVAQGFYLLHTTVGAEPEKYAKIARYIIKYKDGTQGSFDVEYYRHVGLPDGNYNYFLGALNCHITSGGARLWSTWIANPYPDKAIESLSIVSTGAPYYLFGLSLSQTEEDISKRSQIRRCTW